MAQNNNHMRAGWGLQRWEILLFKHCQMLRLMLSTMPLSLASYKKDTLLPQHKGLC